MKICSKCNMEKDDYFYEKGRRQCKNCRKEYLQQNSKEYNQNNKEAIKENKKKYYENNKEDIRECHKKYRENNKEAIKKYKKEYAINNENAIKEYKKEYRKNNNAKIKKYQSNNKVKVKEYNIEYRKNNKNRIKKCEKEYQKNRRKNDINFKLRRDVSINIGRALKIVNSSKGGQSCIKYLVYTIQELKEYIEKQFEPWMNWNNRGKYNVKTWDDNDLSTWKWQIDHIVPQSHLLYVSMEDDNFKKCWALSNLRPYSAKQNLLDGNRR